MLVEWIPLSNQGQGLYCQLWTAFFPLQFMTQVWSTGAMNWSEKKQGTVTYSVDQENEVSKMFIISLGKWMELESTPQSQAVPTLEYGPLNQPITAHLVPKR